MSLLTALDEDSRAESVLAKIADLGEEPAPAAQPTETVEMPAAPEQAAAEEIAAPKEVAETGPEETQVTEKKEEGQTDPAQPVIDAPDSWKAEAKERFKSLPRDLQTVIAEREVEQKATFNRQVNEAAERSRAAEAARKAAEERATSMVQEQQRYGQTLAALTQQMETLDPIIAAYNQTDRVKLARENPAQYTELHAAYEQRMGHLNAIRAEQARVQNEANTAIFQREEKALVEKIPEWGNSEVGQKAMADIRQGAVQTYGYRPEEVRAISDHRNVLVIRDALAYRSLKAEFDAYKQTTEADKAKAAKALTAKRVETPNTVLKPGPSSETTDKVKSDRDKALINKARGVRNLSDKADILSRL